MRPSALAPAKGLLVLAVALTSGCYGPDQFGVNGQPLYEYFPFDGSYREWTFVSEDTSIPHKMVGLLDTEFEEVGGDRVFTIDYTTRCVTEDVPCEDDVLIRSLSLSSDRSAGVKLHGYETPDGAVTLDPPVLLSHGTAMVGDELTTESNGTTWTSTFTSIAPCEILWNPNWDECAHFTLDDGGAGSGIGGELSAAVNYGLVAFHLESDTARWELDFSAYQE